VKPIIVSAHVPAKELVISFPERPTRRV
jgi:hypothetical protein